MFQDTRKPQEVPAAFSLLGFGYAARENGTMLGAWGRTSRGLVMVAANWGMQCK